MNARAERISSMTSRPAYGEAQDVEHVPFGESVEILGDEGDQLAPAGPRDPDRHGNAALRKAGLLFPPLDYRQEASARDLTSELALSTGSSPAAPDIPADSMAETTALPTTTPSARRAAARTWSGVEIPKPTATGSGAANLLTRAASSGRPSGRSLRTPVTPARETK